MVVSDKHRRYDKKRMLLPKINAVRDVDQSVVDKLDKLAVVDGSKKAALIKAIEARYAALFDDDSEKED